MNRREASVLAVIAAAVIAAFAASPATAVDDLILSVAPGSEMVMPGDTVTVTLDVTDLSAGINGVQALLYYDDTLLILDSIVPTDLGLTPPAEGWVEVEATDDGGDLTYAVVTNGWSIAIDHTVATLTFTVIEEGATNVAFRPDTSPFTTKLTVAADNTTIFPNKVDSEQIVLDCDDGVFCNGTESVIGGVCVSSGDPCDPLLCDEANDVCLAPVHVESLEHFYADRFSDESDPSYSFLGSGSAATNVNITNYMRGITGIRVFFDAIVDFDTTPDAAFWFDWTTGTGITFSPVTDEDTAVTVTASVEDDRTVVTIVVADDHIRRRWLKVTIDATQVSAQGVELDGEVTGNPVVLPSGDGTAGGDTVFYLGNVTSDVDGDRKTTLTDIGQIRAVVNPFLPVPITDVFDVDKDGKVLLTDVGDARVDVNPFFELPLITP